MTGPAAAATFASHWRRAVGAVGDRPFLTWESREGRVHTWTYESFDSLVQRTAGGLAAHGAIAGDAVHLVLANSPAFVATWLAAMQLGAWIVPSDPFAPAGELGGHLSRTSARIGICSSDRVDTYRNAVGDRATDLIAVDEDDTTLDVLAGPPVTRARPGPLDRAAVMFTSGTTSAPKGVVITQANYAFAGDVMASAAALTPADRCLVVLPLFHANAQYYSFAAAISAGASVVLIPAFSASGFLAQAARHGATHASLFAAPLRMILAKKPPPEPSIALRHCWFAQDIAAEQHAELTRLFGCAPRQLYGMTETIPAVLSSPALRARHDAIGGPTLGCAVRLAALGANEHPEIQVGGRRGVELFAEYLDDPATTAESFTADGWFRTRDRAWTDEHGEWRFAGRNADVLKVAGENVSTVEIEAVLSAHIDVLEAAVIGEADPMRDEVPIAFVVAAPHVDHLDIDALHQWCEERLSKVKRPRRIEIVEELPRTSVGKIRKFLLRTPAHVGPESPPRHETETRTG